MMMLLTLIADTCQHSITSKRWMMTLGTLVKSIMTDVRRKSRLQTSWTRGVRVHCSPQEYEDHTESTNGLMTRWMDPQVIQCVHIPYIRHIHVMYTCRSCLWQDLDLIQARVHYTIYYAGDKSVMMYIYGNTHIYRHRRRYGWIRIHYIDI